MAAELRGCQQRKAGTAVFAAASIAHCISHEVATTASKKLVAEAGRQHSDTRQAAAAAAVAESSPSTAMGTCVWAGQASNRFLVQSVVELLTLACLSHKAEMAFPVASDACQFPAERLLLQRSSTAAVICMQ